jgi:hypothetical protein
VACGVWGAAEKRVKDAKEEVVWCVWCGWCGWCGREDGRGGGGVRVGLTPGRPGYGPSSSCPCSRPLSPLSCKSNILLFCQLVYCGSASWSKWTRGWGTERHTTFQRRGPRPSLRRRTPSESTQTCVPSCTVHSTHLRLRGPSSYRPPPGRAFFSGQTLRCWRRSRRPQRAQRTAGVLSPLTPTRLAPQ